VTVHNSFRIALRVSVAFPAGPRVLEVPKLFARLKYLKTIRKPSKLIFCFEKLETYGVDWRNGNWPQIHWDTKFGAE